VQRREGERKRRAEHSQTSRLDDVADGSFISAAVLTTAQKYPQNIYYTMKMMAAMIHKERRRPGRGRGQSNEESSTSIYSGSISFTSAITNRDSNSDNLTRLKSYRNDDARMLLGMIKKSGYSWYYDVILSINNGQY